jgi:hypothetical protein
LARQQSSSSSSPSTRSATPRRRSRQSSRSPRSRSSSTSSGNACGRRNPLLPSRLRHRHPRARRRADVRDGRAPPARRTSTTWRFVKRVRPAAAGHLIDDALRDREVLPRTGPEVRAVACLPLSVDVRRCHDGAAGTGVSPRRAGKGGDAMGVPVPGGRARLQARAARRLRLGAGGSGSARAQARAFASRARARGVTDAGRVRRGCISPSTRASRARSRCARSTRSVRRIERGLHRLGSRS